MKKLLILGCCLVAMISCNQNKVANDETVIDSLKQVLANKDAEMNEMLSTINEVQTGFSQINEAEKRIIVANSDEELTASLRDQIRDNFDFIQQTLKDNRNKIAQLQDKLKVSNLNIVQMKRTIELLTSQLEAQNAKLQELQAQLMEKDSLIALQGSQIEDLNSNIDNLQGENERRKEKIVEQDKDLNTAWFVFGTKSELKEQKILQSGDVLRDGDFNKGYFTKIDIRVDKEIKLYSKRATVLTAHPSQAYKLEKDAEGLLTLKITDAKKFWSTSKYLVIQVR